MKYSTVWMILCALMCVAIIFNILSSEVIAGIFVGAFAIMTWCAIDDIIELLKEIRNKK